MKAKWVFLAVLAVVLLAVLSMRQVSREGFEDATCPAGSNIGMTAIGTLACINASTHAATLIPCSGLLMRVFNNETGQGGKAKCIPSDADMFNITPPHPVPMDLDGICGKPGYVLAVSADIRPGPEMEKHMKCVGPPLPTPAAAATTAQAAPDEPPEHLPPGTSPIYTGGGILLRHALP